MRMHLLFAPGRPLKRKSAAYIAIHRELRLDQEEREISRELAEKRSAHLRASQHFRQTGDPAPS